MSDSATHSAWRALDAKLRPFVARRVPAADVEDVLQEIFLRMQRGLAGLRDEERFGAWMYQVARNAISDHHRSAARHPVLDPSGLAEQPAEEPDHEPATRQEIAGYLALFVALLPSPYREALTLTELEGLSQKEAASLLGISHSGMKSRVQRGRALLRRALEDCCHFAQDARGQVVSCAPRTDGRLPNGAETQQLLAGCCPTQERPHKAPPRLAPVRSHWAGADLRDPGAWCEPLGPDERAELSRIVSSLEEHPLESLTPAQLPTTGPLAAASRRWRHALSHGLGFLLLKGLEVDAMTPAQLARSFLVLGLYLGTPAPQTLRGALLTDVRDTGADPALLSTRLYTTRAEQEFHTDGADIIGLLCRRPARSGGASRIVSASAVVDELRRRHPALYPVLFEEFPWHYQEEGFPAAVLSRPICTVPARTEAGALLNTFLIPWYIQRSQELPTAPRLRPEQSEALHELLRIANDPHFFLEMDFQPGDIQWIKNAAILHKRTAYEDHDEPDHKRHLLRLWLRAPDFADGDDQLRAGLHTEALR